MIRRVLSLFLSTLAAACGSSEPAIPEIVGRTPLAGWEGRLTTYDLASTTTGIASRSVTVFVPPGYADAASASLRYPVLYLHDGQNCLDHDAFNHGGWRLHTVATDLIQTGRMKPAILVFVDNTGSRAEEYVPGFGTAPGPTAAGYLDFLERTVVPFVEGRYRVAPGPANRGLGGSSYGGLISLYGAWTRPDTFRLVMAMSPAFGFDFPGLVRQTPGKAPLRIYIDSGTTDYSGGDDGQAATEGLRDLLISKGWVLGTDLKHVIGAGDSHSEDFWRGRLPGALPFVFPP